MMATVSSVRPIFVEGVDILENNTENNKKRTQRYKYVTQSCYPRTRTLKYAIEEYIEEYIEEHIEEHIGKRIHIPNI